MVFPELLDVTRLWVKGDSFTLENLFGGDSSLADQFKGASVAIARLAPQDYHRWHFPVSGHLLTSHPIDGALMTVNPIAINRNINVFTQNKREIYTLQSPDFGLVGIVSVGATMVGSIQTLVQPPVQVSKGQVHGYFQFGGSTVIFLFQAGKIAFDADLIQHSMNGIETLVRVNTRMGVTAELHKQKREEDKKI